MSLSYQGGTLVLYDVPQDYPVANAFQWIKSRWRSEGYHYPTLREWLKTEGIKDNVPRWEQLNLSIQDDREPHDYQLDALAAWQAADCRGSIVLPTGAGKTFVAINAIAQVQRSTVVVAPTIDLLHQKPFEKCLRRL